MAADRMPLHVGLYLALTGARVGSAADLLAIGMATHYVPSSKLPGLRSALNCAAFSEEGAAAADEVEAEVARFAEQPGAASMQDKLPYIEAVLAPGIAAMADTGDASAAVAQVFQDVQDLVRLRLLQHVQDLVRLAQHVPFLKVPLPRMAAPLLPEKSTRHCKTQRYKS